MFTCPSYPHAYPGCEYHRLMPAWPSYHRYAYLHLLSYVPLPSPLSYR